MFQSGPYITLKGRELQDKINHLQDIYYPIDLNKNLFENKIKAMKNLKHILKYASRRDVQASDFEHLIKCALTVLYYFGMRLKINILKEKYWLRCDKKLFKEAEAVFHDTMNTLQPEHSEQTIHVTLDFVSKNFLWPFENFICQIFEVILYYNRGKILLFNLMLTDIHCVVFTDVKSARHRMRVFYELLQSENWIIDKHKLLPFVTRLLDFFICSLTKGVDAIIAYRYLKRGFDVCLRRIFERVQNDYRLTIITTMLNWFSMVKMSSDEILEFSSLIGHAAKLYEVKQYSESFHENILHDILTNFIGSKNGVYSLVGCRLLVRLLDRQRNATFLSVPTIYYEFSRVPLKIGEYKSSDKVFMRQHREQFHDYLIKVTSCHYYSLINLKTMYSLIACTILEVPCGSTAAAASCLAMNIQDFAVTTEELPMKSRFWLHAIVLAIMSLICWVHKAPDLYRYVNEIISRRAKDAPQLNPPLLKTYKLQNENVIWKKPMLFFEDWELRYGLWKHFQSAKELEKSQESFSKKKPTMNIEI